jgi:hypothetical protein
MVRNLKFIAILAALTLVTLACSLMGGDGGSPAGADVPSGVLFQDDFSDPSSGWDQVNEVEGITDYTNGVYRMLVNTDNTDIWANPSLNFTDTVTEVEATKVGGPDDNDLGLICRYQDESNFYFFIISSDGFYGIAKVSDGEQVLVGLESMEYSEAINQGNNTNRLRADCIGQTLTLYVNDQQLLQVTDAQFGSGDVGLIAGTFDVAGTDIHFDNFVVRQP